MKVKVEPIKVTVLPLANVSGSASVNSGQIIVRFWTPSRRIHWTLQVGWVPVNSGVPNAPDVTGDMSIYPLMADTLYGSNFVRMQPVLVAGDLPDGYEAESGVKAWEAVINLESTDTDPARIFAVMTWEPSLVEMCEEEHAYWAGLCNIVRVSPILEIGSTG